MIVYKIIRETDEKLFSMLRHCAIQYTIGDWTEPEFGKIFAFDRLKNAKKYRDILLRKCFAIYLSEVTNKEYIRRAAFINSNYKHFWKNKLDKYKCMSVPEGTVVCDKIKLLERIEL